MVITQLAHPTKQYSETKIPSSGLSSLIHYTCCWKKFEHFHGYVLGEVGLKGSESHLRCKMVTIT